MTDEQSQRRKVGKFWEVWVICPICNKGRWIREGVAKMPHFTGRCKLCYIEVARQEIGLYYRPKESAQEEKDESN